MTCTPGQTGAYLGSMWRRNVQTTTNTMLIAAVNKALIHSGRSGGGVLAWSLRYTRLGIFELLPKSPFACSSSFKTSRLLALNLSKHIPIAIAGIITDAAPTALRQLTISIS